MRVKIVDGNPLAAYTGKLSGVPFVDGVSERPVTKKEARRIGINIEITYLGTDEQAGLLDPVSDIPAAPLVNAEVAVETKPEPPVQDPEQEEVPNLPDRVWTKDELEEVAQEEGIKGIREIAKDYQVKGVQISQLIAGILSKQG